MFLIFITSHNWSYDHGSLSVQVFINFNEWIQSKVRLIQVLLELVKLMDTIFYNAEYFKQSFDKE